MTESSGNKPDQSAETPDLAKSKLAGLLWGVPLALMVAGAFLSAARAWLWTPALIVAGVACLVNAYRCGRLHCYLTGPLYLLGAIATVLRELNILHFSWNWLSAGLIFGTLLAFVPEWLRGKYLGTQTKSEGRGSTCG